MGARLLRFGPFEIDLQTGELQRGTVRVSLQQQPFRILSMLLDRPGDVVSRDTIRSCLWPDGTHVDFEHSVNAAVKRLRAALGETAADPKCIETLPRRGYRLIATISDAASALEADSSADRPRLLVLPIADLSDPGARDGFSDGLTDEMIAQLGKLCGARLGVIARTSSMQLKGTTRTASEIGRSFGAAYLVEGSVRRNSNRLRIVTQLIDAGTETQLWTQSYDRRLADALEVQAEVARAIACELLATLTLPNAGGARTFPGQYDNSSGS